MSNKKSDNLPGKVPASKREDTGGGLYVENLHYNPNSITELRRLAETNPDLAEKIIDGQNNAVKLSNVSEWVGICVTGIIAMTAIVGFVVVVVKLGWWQSIAFTLILLAVSHLLRTILTGEWSDTSWLGRAFSKAGIEPHKDEDTT